ncbi:MAG: sulfatase-like hydrolase/transferase [Bacteroidota bacterium]
MKAIYLSLILFALFTLAGQAQSPQQANIILIIADDAGYADFGFQGSNEFKTPHLDRLASQGMRFSQAYVTAAVCGPSRAGLLTGRYQQRFGFEENNVPGYMDHYGLDDDEMGLPPEEKTIAEYLKQLGYQTALFGKWHQGNADRFHPLKQGFDEFLGFRGGARSYFPFNQAHPTNQHERLLESGFRNFGEVEGYLAYTLANAAADFVERHQDTSFFVMLSFNSVHTPMEVEKKELGQFPELEGKRKKLAAMTVAMDKACGTLLQKIEALGLEQKTLIVFTNDNGGPSDTNGSNNFPLSGTKANHLEGGIRVPFLMKWEGVIPAASLYEFPVSTLDLLPSFWYAAGGDPSQLKDLDGINLFPYLQGKQSDRPHERLFWKKESRAAVRDGDWKLLRFPDRPAELYYLPNDISESNNLADEYPAKVKTLYKLLFEWELTLARPRWQLKRQYEGKAMKRMDQYRQ